MSDQPIRLNRYIALSTGLSRRAADNAIAEGRVKVKDVQVSLGTKVTVDSQVMLDGRLLSFDNEKTTIMLNKPVGYVTSRNGQGSKTIYMLLPGEYLKLKPVGRLDKDSSGLILLTNDGELAQKLTHPSYNKDKTYQVELGRELKPNNKEEIERGIKLSDGISKLSLKGSGSKWTVTMHEGRNRQIRRTFIAKSYKVKTLHRTQFGEYKLGSLPSGKFEEIKPSN